MNPSQSSPVNESSSQPMDVYQQSTPSSPVDRQNEVEKEQEMAELLMTMDNYKAIVRFCFFSTKRHTALISMNRYPTQ